MDPIVEIDTIPGPPALHWRRVMSSAPPVARLIMLPGYGDHIKRYDHVLWWFARRNVESHGFDFRGHGASEGKRGYVGHWDEFLEDFQRAMASISRVASFSALNSQSNPDIPFFLLSHSHGGLVLAVALERGLIDPAGAIFCSPFIRGKVHVPVWKKVIARVANLVHPSLRIKTGLKDHMMSSDEKMLAESRADPLANRCATPRWYLETLGAQRQALDAAHQIRTRSLVLQGDTDIVSDPQASEIFFNQLGSTQKTFHAYPGMRHELLREQRREEVLDRIYNWMPLDGKAGQ